MRHRVSYGTMLALLVCCFTILEPASGRTWTVELDGSGDFTVIQDAVNAAAPMDTILIGAGRYVDLRLFQVGPVVTTETHVGIDKPNLTLIGADRDSVIIGPEVRTVADADGITMQLDTSADLHVENLTITNMDRGVWIEHRATFRNVLFERCNVGAALFPYLPISFESSEFRLNNTGLGSGFSSGPVSVSSCLFDRNDCQVNLGGNTGSQIVDCTILGGGLGITLNTGTRGTLVKNCRIAGATNIGLELGDQTRTRVLGNYIESPSLGVLMSSPDSLVFKGNLVVGGDYSAVATSSILQSLEFSGNDIRKGSGYAALTTSSVLTQVLDFSGNYWYTTDPDTLATWIYDATDDSNLSVTIQYEPFLDVSVPVARASLGGVKSWFQRSTQ